jgi:hypothetical protein
MQKLQKLQDSIEFIRQLPVESLKQKTSYHRQKKDSSKYHNEIFQKCYQVATVEMGIYPLPEI